MYRSFKPLADFFTALILFSALAPLLLVIAVLRWFSDDHPVLFTQKRIGKNGKLFTLYKFCTLVQTPDSRHLTFTRFGKWLRQSSLDELPQLFNVLKGDMSLVGPRPLLAEYLRGFSRLQSRRHQVKPGITGLAQIKGRDGLSWNQKFKLDIQYVEQRSLITDLNILGNTLLILIRESGANPYANTPPVLPGLPRFNNQTIIDPR